MTRLRSGALLVWATAALTGVPAAAAAGWSLPPDVVSGPDPVWLYCYGEGGCAPWDDIAVAQPEVFVDAQGDATAVYDVWSGQKDPSSPSGASEEYRRAHTVNIMARTRPLGGGWSQPVTIATNVGLSTDVDRFDQAAADTRGDVVVVWTVQKGEPGGNRTIAMAVKPAGGAFAPPQTLATAYQPGPVDAAIGANGDLAVAWSTFRGAGEQYRVAVGRIGEKFPARVLSPVTDAGELLIAVDGRGETVAVWTKNGSRQTVWASIRAPGGRFGPARRLNDNRGDDDNDPALAVNARGDAVVAWDFVDYADSPGAIEASVRRAGGRFPSHPRVFAADWGVMPQVAIDDAGDAVVAWRAGASNGYALKTSSKPAGRRFPARGRTLFSFPQVGGPLGDWTSGSSLAMDPASGTAYVAWLEPVDQDAVTLRAAVQPRGGVFGQSTELDHRDEATLAAPTIAAGAGHATVVWGEQDVKAHTETLLSSTG